MGLLTIIAPKNALVMKILESLYNYNIREGLCRIYYSEDTLSIVIKDVFKEVDVNEGAFGDYANKSSCLAYTSESKDWWQKNSDGLSCDWDSFCKIWGAASLEKTQKKVNKASCLVYTSESKDWWQKNSDGLNCDWDSFCKVWEAASLENTQNNTEDIPYKEVPHFVDSTKLPTLEEFTNEAMKHGMAVWQAKLFYEWVCRKFQE